MKAIGNNVFNQDFEQLLTNCETLMEIAVSKAFNKQESFVILLGAKYLQQIASSYAYMLRMDILADSGDKVAKRCLNEAVGCKNAVAAIIARMEANMLVCGINLN